MSEIKEMAAGLRERAKMEENFRNLPFFSNKVTGGSRPKRGGYLKLRIFDGEPVIGELATKYPVSRDGLPVLLVNDEPFSPEEAEFFLVSASREELQLLEDGGYDLPEWEG